MSSVQKKEKLMLKLHRQEQSANSRNHPCYVIQLILLYYFFVKEKKISDWNEFQAEAGDTNAPALFKKPITYINFTIPLIVT